MTTSHKGACFCGAVQIEATGEPAAMGFCHCNSCREWSASPVNAFTLWPPANVKVIKGEDNIGTYNKTPQSFRKFCRTCGGHFMTSHPTFDLTDVYAASLPSLDFKPQLHVFYSETVLKLADGLPKFKDFPTAFGGSGDMLPE